MPIQGIPSLSTLRSGAIPAATPNTLLEASQINIPLNQHIPNLHRNLEQALQAEMEEQEEEEVAQGDGQETYIANALLSLLNLPVTSLTRNYRIPVVMPNLNNGRTAMEQFLQPVIVHPTPEQIAANTTLGNLVSDTEHSCAICQDALTSEQEGRKLNACGHWFHKNCIDTWLGTNVHCPVCRHDIREPATHSEET